MIGYLKDVFPNVSTLALSTIITPTVLEYIRKSLKFYLVTRLYQELLDKANITYMVLKIMKPNFEDLGFLVLNSNRADSIPKTMIFVDNIDKAQYIVACFCTRLLLQFQRKKKEIICTFLSNLKPSTQTDFLRDFRMGNTQIWICTECASIDLNLRDITRIMQ